MWKESSVISFLTALRRDKSATDIWLYADARSKPGRLRYIDPVSRGPASGGGVWGTAQVPKRKVRLSRSDLTAPA